MPQQQTKKSECEFTFALWVGKLPTSRRYNLLPLLRSSPGGFAGSWPYRTYPYFCLKNSTQRHPPVFYAAKILFFFHLSKHNDKIISNLPPYHIYKGTCKVIAPPHDKSVGKGPNPLTRRANQKTKRLSINQ